MNFKIARNEFVYCSIFMQLNSYYRSYCKYYDSSSYYFVSVSILRSSVRPYNIRLSIRPQNGQNKLLCVRHYCIKIILTYYHFADILYHKLVIKSSL